MSVKPVFGRLAHRPLRFPIGDMAAHCGGMDHSNIPPCEATGPDGSRVVIHPHAATDSVADLARAFDLPASTALAIDDRPVAAHDRLLAVGLRVGSAVTVRCGAPDDAVAAWSQRDRFHDVRRRADSQVPDGLAVSVTVGPACERWISLTEGRHTVGRAASAAVRVDDPAVELHHGVLDVGADGSVTFTQLTGAFPVTIDGIACGPSHPVTPAGVLTLGASRLVLRRPEVAATLAQRARGSIVPADRDPWRSVVRRGPSPPVRQAGDVIAVPDPPATHRAPPLTSLVGAGIAAAGAGLLAAVLGQAMFAVFATVGAIASIATWVVGALATRRDRRRSEVLHRVALADFEQALLEAHADAERDHRARHRSVVDALDVIHGDGSDIWSRRLQRADSLWATIGRGTCRWIPPIVDDTSGRLDAELLVTLERCERLVDVPVPVALGPASVIAFHGPPAIGAALTRSVLVQLAATYGPSDWELQVVTSVPHRWSWVSWLPHARGRLCVIDASDSASLVDAMERTESDVGGRRRSVIVLDVPSLLSARTGPVRRRLERGDVTCVAIVEPEASVPAVVDRILELGDTGAARWIETDGSTWTSVDREIVVAGLSAATAEFAARRLAPLIDPEEHDGADGMSVNVSLADLEPIADDASTVIARRWMSAGRDPAPIARIGLSGDGIVDVDLVRDGPHGLVAGTTGAGKSELLRTLVVSLAAGASPDHLSLILVDFKGGSTFDACTRLPHTVGVVTDLDDGLAERVLVSLDAEVRRRERLLRAVRVDDLTSYRLAVDDPLPRLVVVIDEFATLAKELPDFLGALVAIAQRGRSLGIHLLLATQRPAGVVTEDIRANTNLRIALRLQDRTDAVDVVGDDSPARFPAGVPGRAMLRLGPRELVVFQTASTAGPLPRRTERLRVEPAGCAQRVAGSGGVQPGVGPTVLEYMVESICTAAAMVGCASPHRPWIDALPTVVHPRDLAGEFAQNHADNHGTVGVLDDPAEQCRRPLTWTPSVGNLLLVGSVGAGTTTAALGVVAACARMSPPDQLHLYVVDAQGDAAWTTVEAIAHCGAVVRISEIERLTRLLRRLADEMDRRATDGRRDPTIVVAFDGFAAVRDALGDVDHGESALRLDRLLRDGPGLGIVAVITTDGSSSRALGVPRAATWVFHVGDQGIARTVGLRSPAVGPGVPGRLRVVESGLEAQVVFDPGPLRDATRDPAAGSNRRDDRPGGPMPVLVLPEMVDGDRLEARCAMVREPLSNASSDQPVELVVGLGADDLEPAVLRVPVGDHVFIGGAARTGRSTSLRQIEASWCLSHPDGRVIRIDRHQLVVAEDPIGDLDNRCVLVVVDDAERVDDHDGRLGQLITRPGVTFAVAARIEAVRVGYGHWTREVARTRCGLIMTSMGDVDGELLGATLPRRPAIAPRPGLAWMIDQGGHRLVQVAARMLP